MHPSEQLLLKLFERLNAHDVDGIMACYHPEQANFEDIAFRLKNTKQIRAMWHMICFRDAEGYGSDIQATVKAASAGDAVGRTEVEEDYYYGKGSRRRKVHNGVVSTFKFRDRLIIAQKDDCDPVSCQ